ncbi:MAG: hypothetical protein OEV44_04065, partial [Spirochaetota bacterium]|nr:hypothetical protein [Spirochaetota bacterium]
MVKIGDIVAYRDKGNFLLGTILEGKSNKLVLLSEENKKTNISPEKIEILLNKNIPINQKEHELAKNVKLIRNELESKSLQVNLQELYELLKDENEGYTFKTLSEYYFSDGHVVESLAIMALALSNDSLYFKLKNDYYYPKPYKLVQEQIEEKKRSKLNEEKRKEEKNLAINWLKENLNEIQNSNLLPPNEVLKYLEPVKQYVIFRDQYEKKNLAMDIIEGLKSDMGFKIQGNPIESLFNLFKVLNVFKEDENLFLLKYNIPTSFRENTLQEASNIKDFAEEDIKDRLDLRSLFTFTI